MNAFSVLRRPVALPFLAVLAAGLFLRLYQIGGQIIINDEWWSIVKLVDSDYRSIATHLGGADYSIPITLFLKWVAERERLSEAWMLALPFAFGMAAWIGAILAARRHARPLELFVFAGLLAISPLLILYTRQARPYAVTLFLATASIAAAYCWSRRRRPLLLAVHYACGALAVYFHLVVAPIILGVWLAFFVERLRGPCDDLPRPTVVAALGALAVALTFAAVGLPLWNDWRSIAVKAAADHATWESAFRAAMMLAGTGWIVVFLTTAALALAGARELSRRHPRGTRFVIALLALQALAVVLSGAAWLSQQIVVARYLLVALPFLLYAIAVGFGQLCEKALGDARSISWVLAGGFLVAMYFSGPLPAAAHYPNSFFTHELYWLDFDPAYNRLAPVLRSAHVPAFYRALGERPPGSLTVIESPWRFESPYNDLPYLQEVHRQRVMIGFAGRLCPPGAFGEKPLHFRNKFRHFVDLSRPARDLGAKADYVIFHRRLDLSNIDRSALTADGRALPNVDGCITDFRSRFGPPVFEDETITVFDLSHAHAP